MVIVLLAALAYGGFWMLAGSRAYVHGESQWTKAQKQAIIQLLEYAKTGDNAHMDAYREAIAVTLGDRRARLELDTSNPDYEVVREGFRAGRNHPDDISLLIDLFEWSRGVPAFDRAVEIWMRADGLIDELLETGRELERAVASHGPGTPEAGAVVARVIALDERLTEVEQDFADAMSRLSRQLVTVLSFAIVLTAAFLLLAGNLFAYRLLRTAVVSERALRESEERYRALVDQSQVGMWQLDGAGRVSFFNPAMRQLLNLGESTVTEGVPMEEFVGPAARDNVRSQRRQWEQGSSTTGEIEVVMEGGRSRQMLVHGAPVILDDGSLHGHVGTCVDITDRKRAEKRLRHQAYHDPLTGLPNRLLFMDRLEMALRRARRSEMTLAVFFVDLDRFKVVNDSIGHGAGDRLLCEAARRLVGVMREKDTVARFGGDEFSVIVEDIGHDGAAVNAARRIIEAMRPEFTVERFRARIGASVGIAMPSRPEDEPSDLLRFADIAMYVAKRAGGNTWHVFDPEHDAQEEARLQLESEIWAATERDELVVHYQPIVNVHTNRAVALEALVRWQHPERGLLSPAEFIGVAEETGAITRIGHWVTQRACRDLALLRERFGAAAPDCVTVNISDVEFRLGDPAGWVVPLLQETRLPAESLCFEVTETMLMRDPGAIRKLEGLGCLIAIDDFGTGYASLGMLREARFRVLKIDRTFIMGLPDSNEDVAVVEAVTRLGRRLDMRVIAEGVETQAQLDAVLELGCGLVQGHLFSRAVPLDELLEHPDRFKESAG